MIMTPQPKNTRKAVPSISAAARRARDDIRSGLLKRRCEVRAGTPRIYTPGSRSRSVALQPPNPKEFLSTARGRRSRPPGGTCSSVAGGVRIDAVEGRVDPAASHREAGNGASRSHRWRPARERASPCWRSPAGRRCDHRILRGSRAPRWHRSAVSMNRARSPTRLRPAGSAPPPAPAALPARLRAHRAAAASCG